MNKQTLEAIKLGLKSWWKVLLILIVAGLVISGYSFNLGPFGCNKQAVKFSEPEKK